MGEPCRKLSQRGQAVALLFDASGFPNPVGQVPHQARSQFRHFLYKFGEQGSREFQEPPFGERSKGYAVPLHPGERQDPRDVAGFRWISDNIAAQVTAPLKLAFQNHKHPVSGITLPDMGIPYRRMKFLRIAQEPVELIVGQISKCRHTTEVRFFDHLDLAQILMDELNGDRSFTDSGSHALYGTVAYITYRKQSWDIRFQEEGVSIELPALRALAVSYQIGSR